jgi:putative photosynthetic complex assembly protein 2
VPWEHLLPVIHALLLWWAATALVMFLDGLPERTFRHSLGAAASLSLGALAVLWSIRDDVAVWAAYAGFTCSVVIWGWHELAFLTGRLTGSRRHACPAGCGGWRHFGHGVQALLHHELALLATAGLLLALTWGAPNQVGAWAFLLLWGMRQSAKLNLFLGVRNPGAELLPTHLAYLQSFFRQRSMNALFPFSTAAACVCVVLLAGRAGSSAATAFEETTFTLLATLAALGLLEHLLLMMPLRADALWRVGLSSRAPLRQPEVPEPGAPTHDTAGLAVARTPRPVEGYGR